MPARLAASRTSSDWHINSLAIATSPNAAIWRASSRLTQVSSDHVEPKVPPNPNQPAPADVEPMQVSVRVVERLGAYTVGTCSTLVVIVLVDEAEPPAAAFVALTDCVAVVALELVLVAVATLLLELAVVVLPPDVS